MLTKPDEVAARSQLAALDASNVGTWELDVANDRFRCDETAAALYGLSLEESIDGVPIARPGAMVHPDDRAMWRARRALSLRQGGLFVIEYRLVTRRDDIRWVLVRGRYEIEPDGRVLHGRGIVIDLTDSKREGYAEGRASFVDPSAEDDQTGALTHVAVHALAAHRALTCHDAVVKPSLMDAANYLLQEVGLAIAGARVPGGVTPLRH